MDYSAQSFWEEQFFESQMVRDEIARVLKRGAVSTLQELAELAVRLVLESNPALQAHPIYSPERTYSVGDTLAFLGHTGVQRGLVVHVVHGRTTNINKIELSYDLIRVRFKTARDIRNYVSNCPHFPTRFSYNDVDCSEPHPEGVVTPGQIVTKFQQIIVPSVKAALIGDGRFSTYDGEDWMLTEFLTEIDDKMIRAVLVKLRESVSALPTELASFLFGPQSDSGQLARLAFSVSYHLSLDVEHRFNLSRATSQTMWMLSPPPKQVVCTLDEDMISNGRIRVSREFQKIVDFYGMTSVLDIQVHGGYRLRALYDPDVRIIYGEDIRSWLEENRVSAGHKVYVKSPSVRNAPLVLFSEFEHYQPPEPREMTGETHPKLFLRHKIYEVLVGMQEWLHYREISERLRDSGFEVKPETVIAILSSDTHLFCRREPARGLWGLTRWLGDSSTCPVNLQSLAITIGEEKWVSKVLGDEGAPLTSKEIIRRLSEIFGVKFEMIQELTVIDATDPEFRQLADGRWILSKWVDEWQDKLKDCEKDLARCRELRDRIAKDNRQLKEWQRKISELEASSVNESELEKQLEGKIGSLSMQFEQLSAKPSTTSVDIRSSESKIAVFERRTTSLLHWRWASLASCTVFAAALPLGPPHLFKISALAISGIAYFALLISRRRIFTKLRTEREKLGRFTALAQGSSARARRIEAEISGAKERVAEVRSRMVQLKIEEDHARMKARECQEDLIVVQSELEKLGETTRLEERSFLRQLLVECSEVAHD